MGRVSKTNTAEINEEIRKRLWQYLCEYQATKLKSNKEMYTLAGVSRMTWHRWKTGKVQIPISKVETLIRRFDLNRDLIMGTEVTKTDIFYKEFLDYGQEYSAYVGAGRIKAAIQVMRRAGGVIFDILHSYGFSVDCLITNRKAGWQDSVHITVHLNGSTYLLELSPTNRLTYQFKHFQSGDSRVLHDGVFSNSVLNAIIDYLEDLRKNFERKKEKTQLNTATFISKSREVEKKFGYE